MGAGGAIAATLVGVNPWPVAAVGAGAAAYMSRDPKVQKVQPAIVAAPENPALPEPQPAPSPAPPMIASTARPIMISWEAAEPEITPALDTTSWSYTDETHGTAP